jgi:hypothetical protein
MTTLPPSPLSGKGGDDDSPLRGSVFNTAFSSGITPALLALAFAEAHCNRFLWGGPAEKRSFFVTA